MADQKKTLGVDPNAKAVKAITDARAKIRADAEKAGKIPMGFGGSMTLDKGKLTPNPRGKQGGTAAAPDKGDD